MSDVPGGHDTDDPAHAPGLCHLCDSWRSTPIYDQLVQERYDRQFQAIIDKEWGNPQ